MPELPEVETYIRELGPQLVGRRVERAQVFWPRTIAEPDAQQFSRQIAGRHFSGYDRRGKFMLFHLAYHAPNSTSDRPTLAQAPMTLIVHLRMTGKLFLAPPDHARDKHTHVVFDLGAGPAASADQRLVFVDTRKFGRIWLTAEPARVLAKLGPEPLSPEFSPAVLGEKLARRRAAVKALLLDQAIVAGVGNIYADEALFRAHIHPARPGDSLDQTELTQLHAAVCQVLEEGIARQGSSLGGSALQNYIRPSGEQGSFQEEHRVFRRTGCGCYTCQTPIERIVIAQRSTHYCPVCQPLQP